MCGPLRAYVSWIGPQKVLISNLVQRVYFAQRALNVAGARVVAAGIVPRQNKKRVPVLKMIDRPSPVIGTRCSQPARE